MSVPCLHAGCRRERASSSGAPQATKPSVDLKQKRKKRSREGHSRTLVDWERQGHGQTSARERLAPIDYRNGSCFGLVWEHRPYFTP